MQHFRCYSQLYNNDDLKRLSGAAHQAVRYALLLHLRLLIDFFFAEARQDDCHVNHFNILDGFEAAFPASIHLSSDRTRRVSVDLNKLLAHITATRWEKNRPLMNHYAEFIPIIHDLITRFETALPDDKRGVYLEHCRKWECHHPATLRRA